MRHEELIVELKANEEERIELWNLVAEQASEPVPVLAKILSKRLLVPISVSMEANGNVKITIQLLTKD